MTSKNLQRRSMAVWAFAHTAPLAMMSGSADAQKPTCCPGDCCPTSLVVPFPPGGTTDALAHLLAPLLGTQLGTAVVVENKAGAGGVLGANAVAKGPNTGGQVLLTNQSVELASLLLPRLPFNFRNDLVPVAMLASSPLVLLVPSTSSIKSVGELVTAAKSRPQVEKYASPGKGTLPQFASELLNQLAGIETQHVPYRGSGPALADLTGGQVGFGFFDPQAAKSERVRALAVTTQSRSPVLPNVPTMEEQGVKGFSLQQWFGIFLPKGAPAASVERWQAALTQAMSNREVATKLSELGLAPQLLPPGEFQAVIERESATLGRLAKQRNITLD